MIEQIQKLERLTRSLILWAAILLSVSYFLPFEDWSWSYYRMAHGYGIAGGQMTGPIVALFSTMPSLLGLVLVVAMALRRFQRIATLMLFGYGFVWLGVVATYVILLLQMPDISFRPLWLGFCSVSLPIFISALLLVWKHLSSPRTFSFMAMLLSCSSLVVFIADIAYSILEDNMLINYGAVICSVAAVVLIIGFMIDQQVQAMLEKLPPDVRGTVG